MNKENENIDAESVCRNKNSNAEEHLKHLLKLGWSVKSSVIKSMLNKYPELKEKINDSIKQVF